MDNKTREIVTELSGRFSVNDNFYLEKALIFLKQFQHGAVSKKTKRVKAIDISGVSPKDIHYIRINLRDVFGYQIINTPEVYTEDKNMEFIYESTDSLNTAIALLEFIKSGKDKKLTVKDGFFFYLGEPLDIRKGNLRNLLNVTFSLTGGNSGIIKYQDFFNALRKEKAYKKKSDTQLKQFIQKYLTSRGYHLDAKVQAKFNSAVMLFETVDGVGVKFLNDK